MTTTANVLRPFAAALTGKSALLIGPDTVAIEAFLAANETTVTKYDKDEFLATKTSETFDTIIWLGGKDEDITAESKQLPNLLVRMNAVLAENGLIFIAHRNPVWLDQHGTGKTGTFLAGMMLDHALLQVGLIQTQCYYLFPDHDEPAVLFCDRAFETAGFELANLILPNFPRSRTGRAKAAVSENGICLTKGLSGSFLLTASKTSINPIAADTLAFSFNSTRAPEYNKMNVFYEKTAGSIMVRRVPYNRVPYDSGRSGFARHPPPKPTIKQDLSEEPYLPGRMYSLVLADMLTQPGWSVQTIRSWAEPWIDLLKTRAADGWQWLDGRYLDLAPFNLLFHEGALSAIDLEWIGQEPVPVNYVFFRGLYHCLSRMPEVGQPVAGTPTNVFSLALAVAETMVEAPDALLAEFLTLETRYFGSVFPGNASSPGDLDLAIIGPDPCKIIPDSHPDALTSRRLYSLFNLNVQVFVETATTDFSEDRSTWLSIGLSRERKHYTVALPHFTAGPTRFRVDPADRSGLIRIHSINLRTAGGLELFHWTPYSRTELEMNGIVILNAGHALPEPVMILVNNDPMLIFTLPAHIRDRPWEPVELELEVSALSESLSETVLGTLRELATLTP